MDLISPFAKREALKETSHNILREISESFLPSDILEENYKNLINEEAMKKLLINTDPATIYPYEKREASHHHSLEKRDLSFRPLMKKREAMVFCADICDDSNYS